jgi:hypothetical protein
MKKILDWFADEMKKKGFKTFRCKNPICKAVRWLELNEGSTLDDVITGEGGITMMRYGHILESDCPECSTVTKAAEAIK